MAYVRLKKKGGVGVNTNVSTVPIRDWNAPPVGTGERFRNLVRKLRARGVNDPKALAAAIGRKKYGKERFQKMAARGRRRKSRR